MTSKSRLSPDVRTVIAAAAFPTGEAIEIRAAGSAVGGAPLRLPAISSADTVATQLDQLFIWGRAVMAGLAAEEHQRVQSGIDFLAAKILAGGFIADDGAVAPAEAA